MKKLLIIFFLIINSQQSLATQEEVALSKVNVQKEAAKKSFCKKNNNFFINNLKKDHYPSKIEIKTNKVKTWYINLIKSFYSTPRSKWSIDRDYKKYSNAKIILHFGDQIKCKFNGKVKIHGGRKDHINLKNLTSSLRVKLFDGHLNHSKHFGLLRPFTRNYDDEIFITTILNKLDLISPNTFYVDIKLNDNRTEKMIFLDMDYIEILEKNNRPQGVILAENKTTGFNKNFTLSRIVNLKSTPLKIPYELNKNSFFNALDKTNYIVLNEKFYNYKNILNDLNNRSFINEEKFIEFYLMMFATGGDHGKQLGDRRYYYNILLDEIEPVYYDWKPRLLTNKYKYIKKDFFYNFKNEDIDNLISKLNKLDFFKINKELKNKGLSYNEKDLLIFKEKIIQNLLLIKESKNEDMLIKGKIANYNYPNYLLFHKNQNDYERCDLIGNCKKIKLTSQIEEKLFQNHEHEIDNKKMKFTRKNFNDLKKNVVPLDFSIKRMNKVKLSERTKVYFNNDVSVIKDDKIIKINFLNEQGRVKIIGGTLEKYKFIVSGENQNKNPWKKDLMNKDNVIPFCLVFYDTKLIEVQLSVKNLNGHCYAAVKFIKSEGSIKKIDISNVYGDALKTKLSKINFDKILIKEVEDDCIDFETGNYTINEIKLSNCWDKSIQLRNKSFLYVKNLQVEDSLYGPTIMNSSSLIGDNFNINSNRECLVAYRENNEYYGSKIYIKNELNCSKNKFYSQEGSTITYKDVIQN